MTARPDTARFALASACWARGDGITCDEEALIDLLTDLRHFCAAAGLSFDEALRLSIQHFAAETGEAAP
jgi:hypothetical protein